MKSKHGNIKCEVDGRVMDSKREANRYAELKLLVRSGEIKDLQLQVPFTLIPSQKIDGKVVERPVKYIADFVYETADGLTVVEDAKGYRTKDYIIKRKLMLWEFGIHVREV